MKTKVFLFTSTIIIMVVIVLGCQKKPTACFDASETNVSIHENISFRNCSTDGYTYAWDFGDGEHTTEHSPSHYYNYWGKYDVKLTVYSKGEKKSDVATVTVTVNCPIPTAVNPYSISSNSFTAKWYSISGYDFYLDVAKDTAFTDFVYNNLNVGPYSESPVTGLTSNTTYYYRVRVCSGLNSNIISVTTQ